MAALTLCVRPLWRGATGAGRAEAVGSGAEYAGWFVISVTDH